VLYETAVRPLLFRVGGGDAERAHHWTLRRLDALSRRPRVLAALHRLNAVDAPREVFGVRFPNPVGLAAGMDKDGDALDAWPALGFGFVEVGTVTWHPQPGNEHPRLFRLRASQALVNRMGFNNAGARTLAGRLAARARRPRAGAPRSVPLGISLGKSRVTLLEEAVTDYLASLRVLYPYGDYFALNVSSPNTPGLRSLQDRPLLERLLGALREEARGLAGDRAPKPLLVKIDPDLSEAAIGDVLQACTDHGVAGVIATNTTLVRDGVEPSDATRALEAGGLSGRPLTARTREVVSFVSRLTGGRLPIIGVGGVLDPDDALRLVDAGASLVQIYTGLVYRGPGLVRRTAEALRDHAADGS
jgi:dihydroorotate dehydrogenase